MKKTFLALLVAFGAVSLSLGACDFNFCFDECLANHTSAKICKSICNLKCKAIPSQCSVENGCQKPYDYELEKLRQKLRQKDQQ